MISELTAALRVAKAAEEKAKAERLDIEEKMLALFSKPVSGEGTHNDEDFSIVWKLNRTVDTDKLTAAFDQLPVNAQRAFRWKADVELLQASPVCPAAAPRRQPRVLRRLSQGPRKNRTGPRLQDPRRRLGRCLAQPRRDIR